MLFHFAQLFTRPEDPRRRVGAVNRVSCYRRAAPHLDPPVLPVAIPSGELELPGYLRAPSGKRAAAVLMLPGANSVKEELHHWAEALVHRGLVTLTLDGPGQGELSVANGGPPLRFETYPRTVSSAIAWLADRPEVDPEAIGVWGQSTGGQLAIRVAAVDPRVSAAVSLSGAFDFRCELSSATPVDVREEARDLHGFADFGSTVAYVREHGSLAGVIEQVVCPVLLVHGGQDDLVSSEEIVALRSAGRPSVDLLEYPDGNHGVCDFDAEMTAEMADWLAERLRRP
jgi:2,6-dihydroxypseudooxynicotine hydrolase